MPEPVKPRNAPPPASPVVLDASGRAVPDHLADVFGDPTLRGLVGDLKRMGRAASSLSALVEEARRSHGEFYPAARWLTAIRWAGEAGRYLMQAAEELADGLPLEVCKPCRGRGCGACGSRGYTVKEIF